jgi:hypothetical protein
VAPVGIRAQSLSMAPVTRGRGNRFAHSEDGNNREGPVREESPAAYQAHSEAQFASLREQIAVLTRQLSIMNVQDRRRHIPSPHDSEEEDARVENEDGNPFVERGVLRPIGGNPVSNSIFGNSTGVSNPRNSWTG